MVMGESERDPRRGNGAAKRREGMKTVRGAIDQKDNAA